MLRITIPKKMSADGYMTEVEFKDALIEIAEKKCGNIWGPLNLPIAGLRTNPPQSYYGGNIKTREDIEQHIGCIYAEANMRPLYPRMGKGTVFTSSNFTDANLPQYFECPLAGMKEINTFQGITVRNLGHRVFLIKYNMPDWLSGFLRLYRKKYNAIIAQKPKSGAKIEKKYALPPADLVEYLGVDETLGEMWQFAVAKKIEKRMAADAAKRAELVAQLDQLSGEIISALEKITVKPKYLDETNFADMPIYATFE